LCPSCGEVTEVYEYPQEQAEAFARRDALIQRLLTQSALHDRQCLAAVSSLPSLRAGLAA
jgi:hypothetical protein